VPVVVLLTLIGWTVVHVAPAVLLFVKQWRAVEYRPPTDHVVFRQEEDLGDTMVIGPNAERSRIEWDSPRPWFDFTVADKLALEDVYVGEHDAGHGRRIVCVYIVGTWGAPSPNPPGTRRFCLGARVLQPATVARPPVLCGQETRVLVDLVGSRPLRVFAGQRFPSDPSRFTIDCDTSGPNGGRETLDCTLLGDDTVQRRFPRALKN